MPLTCFLQTIQRFRPGGGPPDNPQDTHKLIHRFSSITAQEFKPLYADIHSPGEVSHRESIPLSQR